MALLIAFNSHLLLQNILQKHWTNALKHLAGWGGHWRSQSIIKLENVKLWDGMATTITERNDTQLFLLLGSNAIESIWPFAPDYQNAFLINKTHLSSCLMGCLLTAPKKKTRLVFGGQWEGIQRSTKVGTHSIFFFRKVFWKIITDQMFT